MDVSPDLPEPTRVWDSEPKPEWVIPIPATDTLPPHTEVVIDQGSRQVRALNNATHVLYQIRQGRNLIIVPERVIDQVIKTLQAAREWGAATQRRHRVIHDAQEEEAS